MSVRQVSGSKTRNIVRSLTNKKANIDSTSTPKSFAILATFVINESDASNVRRLCKFLKRNNFTVICVNPGCFLHCETDDDGIVSSLGCDLYVERMNAGHDFGSWAEAYFLLKQKGLLNADVTKELLLINDSCYLANETTNVISRARASCTDVVSLTESYQVQHHMQSNFMLFRNYKKCETVLDDFFSEYLNGSINSKEDVIRYGELALSRNLKEYGLSWSSVYDITALSRMTIDHYVNCDEGSWEQNTAFRLQEGHLLNPHHYLHEALYLQLGCPLIKKDFIRNNPSAYPKIENYRSMVVA